MEWLVTFQGPSAISSPLHSPSSQDKLSRPLTSHCKHSQPRSSREVRPSGLCQFFSFCLVRPGGRLCSIIELVFQIWLRAETSQVSQSEILSTKAQIHRSRHGEPKSIASDSLTCVCHTKLICPLFLNVIFLSCFLSRSNRNSLHLLLPTGDWR